jgi:uracil-DNA glycosylase
VLLLGELNPRGADPRAALYHQPPGCSGDRLRHILGLSTYSYLRLGRANLCDGRWDPAAARTRYESIVTGAVNPSTPTRTIVLLGARVRGITRGPAPFRVESFTTSQAITAGHARKCFLVGLPHPSGRCRTWSKPGTVDEARRLLRQVAPEVPWGETGASEEGP